MPGEENNILTEIVGAAENLPAPVETALFKALSNLVGGLTAIPAGWLRRHAQADDDITNARSAVATALARGVAENALNDPIVMQAAAEVYMPTAVRKVQNRIHVAELALEHVADSAARAEKPSPPDDDWMNTFCRYAEDASSEKLQDLFARILSGEILRPGSFGPATLRTVSELDRKIAEDFTLTWAKSVGGAVDNDASFQMGEWFSRWKRLVECGLMAADASAQYLPEFNPVFEEYSLWSPMMVQDTYVMVYFSKGASARWDNIPFTRVGVELGSILERPNYAENMRRAGIRLGQKFGLQVELRMAQKPAELLTKKK